MATTEPQLFTGLFTVNGATRLYGTIGDPIRQLRATTVMSQVFAAVGVNAVWLPFEGGPALLPVMLKALSEMKNLGGFTVTIPHKTAILPLLGRVTKRAQASGSVNLVKREADGTLAGDIADGLGFVKGLEAQGYQQPPIDQLIAMRIHGVKNDFIKDLKELGYDRIAIDQLVAMRIHFGTSNLKPIKRLNSKDLYMRLPAKCCKSLGEIFSPMFRLLSHQPTGLQCPKIMSSVPEMRFKSMLGVNWIWISERLWIGLVIFSFPKSAHWLLPT